MEIEKTDEKRRELLDMIGANFMKTERTGIHLSSLLSPLESYWRMVDPRPPSDLEIQYWVIGRGHEDALHRISGMGHVEDRVWNGIYYGLDFESETGVPIEMKTRRGYLAKEGEEAERYSSYIAQLIGYCACENKTEGELWIWSLLEKTDAFRSAPALATYKITFTEEELDNERERLLNMKRVLMAALQGDQGAYLALPKCPEWKCLSRETKIDKLPECKTCAREFKTDWGLEKHLESKGGKGHNVIYATYTVTTMPKCKWFDKCSEKGKEND